jgi:hypothetical protein
MNTVLDFSDSERGTGVLKSTLPVVEQARHVWIDERGVARLAQLWTDQKIAIPPWNEEVHWADGSHRTASAILLLDAWNFCFWPEPGEVKWGIDYNGKAYNGYMGLAAAIKRAIEEGDALYEPARMASLTIQDLEHIFRGRGEMPMLETRLANAHQIGRCLLDSWNGDFVNMLAAAEGSAVALTSLVVENFPCFNDHTLYFGREVKFFKRAQILVIDLMGCLAGDSLVDFHDADRLTAFADYKIPQVLEAHKVLRYTPQLEAMLERYEQIPEGDPLEVEIRAGMVWAVEFLRLEMEARGRKVAPYELDWLLWNLGQQPVPDEKPYHRTRTVFY